MASPCNPSFALTPSAENPRISLFPIRTRPVQKNKQNPEVEFVLVKSSDFAYLGRILPNPNLNSQGLGICTQSQKNAGRGKLQYNELVHPAKTQIQVFIFGFFARSKSFLPDLPLRTKIPARPFASRPNRSWTFPPTILVPPPNRTQQVACRCALSFFLRTTKSRNHLENASRAGNSYSSISPG